MITPNEERNVLLVWTLDSRTTISPPLAVSLPAFAVQFLFITQVVYAAPPEKIPAKLQRWLTPQHWQRDTKGPVLSLGKKSAFDDMHIFAPCVAYEDKRFRLWYSGSRGAVAKRVFHMGLATSADGKRFHRHAGNPVFGFGDGKLSVLTVCLLRNADGSVLRESGKLRLWFSATDFRDKSGLHTLHETTSRDGVRWAAPSAALLKHVYAPTILKEKSIYRMWYTDVSGKTWVIRHAQSNDGGEWTVTKKPVLIADQKWERGRLFYPAVIKADGVYLMWYGSYWSAQRNKTAIGFAVSLDGLKWYKHPRNPVLRPDPKRPWESHYTISQSVLWLPDGSFRICSPAASGRRS